MDRTWGPKRLLCSRFDGDVMIGDALELTICVVLYKSSALSRRFVEEIRQSLASYSEWELIFFDNSPTDELSDLKAFGTYLHDPRNLGFSYGNNQAILRARYPNIALVNPDVFGFTPAFWDAVRGRAFGKAEVRFARLVNEDGSFQDCVGRVAGPARALSPRRDYARISAEVPIEMGIMAFMMTSRDVFARVGLLDCDYPLYAEDMDWCYRAGRAGVAVLYDPELELTHLGGASASDRWSRKESLKRKYAAEEIFIDKHFRGFHWLAARALQRLKLFIKV